MASAIPDTQSVAVKDFSAMNDMTWQTFLWSLTALSLMGTALNVKKNVLCFYLWAIGNVAWFTIDVLGHVWARALLDAVHFAFAVWGAVSWRSSDRAKATS